MRIASFFRSPPIERNDLENLESQLQKTGKKLENSKLIDSESLRFDYEKLREKIIVLSFEKKAADPSFQLSRLAQKVYDTALKITEEKDREKIFSHGKEYAFLTSERHYIHKHIETLEKWRASEQTPKSCKVEIIDGKIQLKTYADKGFSELTVYHDVEELQKNAELNPKLRYEYTYYSCDSKEEYPTELKPSFKIKGDGNYHVSVVTDCPYKQMSLTGNHTWLRLIDPEGHVISVGKYPKKLSDPYFYVKDPVSFSSSDNHEWLCRKGAIQENSFIISKEDYDALSEDILNDLVSNLDNENSQDFNVFNENCTDWAIEKVGKIGLNIEKNSIQVDQFVLLFPKFNEWYNNKIPLGLRKAIAPIKNAASFLILQTIRIAFICILGGGVKNEKNPSSKKFLYNFKQLFNYRVTHLTHPWKLRRYLDGQAEKIQSEYNQKAQSPQKTQEENFTSEHLRKTHSPQKADLLKREIHPQRILRVI